MSDINIELTVKAIYDDGSKTKVAWEVLESPEESIPKYIDSLFELSNRNEFFEATQSTKLDYKSVKGKKFRGRVFQPGGTNKWLVAPESLFEVSEKHSSPILTVKSTSSPIDKLAEVVSKPSPNTVTVLQVKSVPRLKGADTMALNEIAELIRARLKDGERIARLKDDSLDAVILQKLLEVADLIGNRRAK